MRADRTRFMCSPASSVMVRMSACWLESRLVLPRQLRRLRRLLWPLLRCLKNYPCMVCALSLLPTDLHTETCTFPSTSQPSLIAFQADLGRLQPTTQRSLLLSLARMYSISRVVHSFWTLASCASRRRRAAPRFPHQDIQIHACRSRWACRGSLDPIPCLQPSLQHTPKPPRFDSPSNRIHFISSAPASSSNSSSTSHQHLPLCVTQSAQSSPRNPCWDQLNRPRPGRVLNLEPLISLSATVAAAAAASTAQLPCSWYHVNEPWAQGGPWSASLGRSTYPTSVDSSGLATHAFPLGIPANLSWHSHTHTNLLPSSSCRHLSRVSGCLLRFLSVCNSRLSFLFLTD